MKKIILSLLVILCITGCTNSHIQNVGNINLNTNNETMYIQPTKFSEETMNVLDLFDDEIQFFDVSLNENANSYDLSIWIFRDGEWVDEGKTYGDIKFIGDRIAIRLSDTSCDLYNISDDMHDKVTYQLVDTSFNNSKAKFNWKLDDEVRLELNKEVPIWIKIGSNESSFATSDCTQNFRELDCTVGIAITLTISDKIVD